MAARKPVMTPAPARPGLEELIERARNTVVTEAQLQEQRASFAYGNAPVGAAVTKESIRTASQSIRLRVA